MLGIYSECTCPICGEKAEHIEKNNPEFKHLKAYHCLQYGYFAFPLGEDNPEEEIGKLSDDDRKRLGVEIMNLNDNGIRKVWTSFAIKEFSKTGELPFDKMEDMPPTTM